MTDHDFREPFGPVYARPQATPCPDCECCTKALCDKAREASLKTMRRCEMHAAEGDYDLVRSCPCPTVETSAMTAPGLEDLTVSTSATAPDCCKAAARAGCACGCDLYDDGEE